MIATKWPILRKLNHSVRYNQLQVLIAVANLLFVAIQWSYRLELVDFFENLFLLNYLLDGILKLNIVGKDIFLYPSVIVFDLLLPLMLYSLFVSGLRLPKRLLWSTLMFVRFLYPDRYLRFDFLRKGNVIIRVIVNSFSYQLYLCAVLGFLILGFSQIGQILFGHLNYNLLIFEPNHMPFAYSSFFLSFVHLTSNTFTDDYDQATSTMRIRNEFCRKTDPYHRYFLIAEKEIVRAVDYQVDLHNLDESGRSLPDTNKTLILCDVTHDSSGFYLNFTYDSDQIKHLMRIIHRSCTKDTLMIEQSELLNCDFNLESYTKKIKYMFAFRNKLNLALASLFDLMVRNKNFTFNVLANQSGPADNRTMKSTDSDKYYNFLIGFCDELRADRFSLIKSDDDSRFGNYSMIGNVIHLDFLNVFKFIISARKSTKVPLDQICTQKTTIKLFYLIFFILTKVFILNILKAILFKRYDVENVRDLNGFFNSDVQQFINRWRSFADSLDGTRLDDPDRLPVNQVLDFLLQKCPPKFELQEPTAEGCLYILCKYSVKLSCLVDPDDLSCLRKVKMRMHLLDVLSVCIAVRLNCRYVCFRSSKKTTQTLGFQFFSFHQSPTVFHFNYPQIARNLASHILRTFPTYELNQGHSISLEELVNQHYLTKMFVLSKLSSKLAPQTMQTK